MFLQSQHIVLQKMSNPTRSYFKHQIDFGKVSDSVGFGIHHIPCAIISTRSTISKMMLPIKLTALVLTITSPPSCNAVVTCSLYQRIQHGNSTCVNN